MKFVMKRIGTVVVVCAVALIFSFGLRAQNAADGAKLYDAKKCAVCHGADGHGNTPVGKTIAIHDFSSALVQQMTDAQLVDVIANGKNKMPAYNKQLKDAEIKSLVAYTRELGKK
jgi:mono/diheme cytochrome c family protein